MLCSWVRNLAANKRKKDASCLKVPSSETLNSVINGCYQAKKMNFVISLVDHEPVTD